MRALADEKAELAFLLKQPDDDASDLRMYAAAASKSLGEFMSLVPKFAPAPTS